MQKVLIAIPSEAPGGLDAAVGAHFGHCEMYTLVKIELGAVSAVETIPNVPHQQGGCLAPVQYLANRGVNLLIAGGMGMRPLMGFQEMGIDVFHSGGAPKVGVAVENLLAQKLTQFGNQHTCGGGHASGGCGNH